MWVLIIVTLIPGHYDSGSVITTQEFSSMLKCQTAQQMIKDETVKLPDRRKAITICVEK